MFTDEAFYIAVVMGLCLGSLATALVYRLPRGISMITQEHSRCPSCGRTLGFFDLIPVLSWLGLRGRCRGCGVFYGWRYLLIELAVLSLCLAVFFLLPETAPRLALYFAACVLVALAAIDLEWQILPDKLNLALAGCFALGLADIAGLWPLDGRPAEWDQVADILPQALGGAALYAFFPWLLGLLVQKWKGREALGLGDVKFLAAAGLWLGPDPQRMAMYMIAIGVIGVVLALFWRRRYGEAEFPFGPSLIIAFAAALLGGQSVLLAG